MPLSPRFRFAVTLLSFLGVALARPFAAASQQSEAVPPPPPAPAETDAEEPAEDAAQAGKEAEPIEPTAQVEAEKSVSTPESSGDDPEVAKVLEDLTRSEDEVFERAAQTRTGGVVLTEEEQNTILQGSFTKSIRFATANENFVLQPFAWVQPLVKLHITPDADGESLEGSGFELQRARFGLRSELFNAVSICLLVGAKTGNARLEAYFVDIHPFGEEIALKVGYFRTYFGRQFLMSTMKLQMIDYARAWTDPRLGLGIDRDLGAGLHGLVLRGIEYGFGVWNGEPGLFSVKSPKEKIGDKTIPGNIDMMVGGRIAVHPFALARMSEPLLIGNECDIERSPSPRASLGLAFMYNRRHDNEVTLPTSNLDERYEDSRLKFGVDLGFQMLGFSVLAEAFILTTTILTDDQDVENAAIDLGRDATGFGTYLQLGYFFVPEKFEVAGRFDLVDENTDVQGARLFPALGMTYYVMGNNFKVQAMYRFNAYTQYDAGDPFADNPDSHDLMVMLQAAI